MKKNTKEKLLENAELLFSKNGFYGTSINDVAKAVNVSKQALLHHFPSKEKLYGAVLEKATNHLGDFVAEAIRSSDQANEQLHYIFNSMLDAQGQRLLVILLLIRELLDNRDRIENAHKWYLAPFIEALVDMVSTAQEQGDMQEGDAFTLMYQMLGAVQYFVISQPTLEKLFSEQEFSNYKQSQKSALKQQLNIKS
ncbi:MAG: TetR family transcriptional regulator [Alteromonadaceae bacterium]|nr:TetR family transcriptional regulator [Alteromonadaceae bacterium]